MGHTVWSQRIVARIVEKELKDYGKSLRKEDRDIYERILKRSLKHLGSVSYASSIDVWAMFLLSIILEQEKKILELEDVVDGHIQASGKADLMDKGPGEGYKDREDYMPAHLSFK